MLERALTILSNIFILCYVTCGSDVSRTPLKVLENDTVLLPCHVDNFEPHTRMLWLKDAEVLADTHAPYQPLPDRFRMFPNRTLQITAVNRDSDTANYTCEVIRSEPFSPIKQVHQIEVQYQPRISLHPPDGFLEVQKGEYVDIGCNVSSNPNSTLTWSKNGDPMILLDQRHRLRFKAESRSLGGVYECTAKNGIGDAATGSIRVVILDAPVVSAQELWVHTTPSLRSSLQAVLESSNPPATTSWYKDGKLVHPDDRIVMNVRQRIHELVIRNVRESDLGNYVFRAENRYGMSDVSFRLTGAPNTANFRLDPNRVKATATTFTLQWEVDTYSIIIEYNLWTRPYLAHRDGSQPVTEDTVYNKWRKIVVPGSDDGIGPIHSVSYTVKGLTPGRVYEAFVTSRNRFGWSKPSNIVRFPINSGESTPPSPAEVEETPLVEDIAELTNHTSLTHTYTDTNSASVVCACIGVILTAALCNILK